MQVQGNTWYASHLFRVKIGLDMFSVDSSVISSMNKDSIKCKLRCNTSSRRYCSGVKAAWLILFVSSSLKIYDVFWRVRYPSLGFPCDILSSYRFLYAQRLTWSLLIKNDERLQLKRFSSQDKSNDSNVSYCMSDFL